MLRTVQAGGVGVVALVCAGCAILGGQTGNEGYVPFDDVGGQEVVPEPERAPPAVSMPEVMAPMVPAPEVIPPAVPEDPTVPAPVPIPVDPAGPPPGPVAVPANCTLKESMVSPDEPSVFGATASELAAALSGAATNILWLPPTRVPFTYQPGPGNAELVFAFSVPSVEARQFEFLPSSNRLVAVEECRGGILEVEVDVTTTTSDGALSEMTRGSLRFEAKSSARLEFELPVSQVAGELRFLSVGAGWNATTLGLSTRLWSNGSQGFFLADFERSPGERQNTALAIWPVEPPACQYDVETQVGSLTALSVVSQLNEMQGVISLNTSGPTPLHLLFEPPRGCISFSGGDSDTFIFTTRAMVMSEASREGDPRLLLDFPVQIEARTTPQGTLHWVRFEPSVDDAEQMALSSQEVFEQTGLVIGGPSPAEYYWSLHGTLYGAEFVSANTSAPQAMTTSDANQAQDANMEAPQSQDAGAPEDTGVVAPRQSGLMPAPMAPGRPSVPPSISREPDTVGGPLSSDPPELRELPPEQWYGIGELVVTATEPPPAPAEPLENLSQPTGWPEPPGWRLLTAPFTFVPTDKN